MTRYAALDSADGYQSSRRFSLNASRQTARVHPLGNHIIGLQTDSDHPTEKGRKRIAVACSRCRKRKIKCSGDPKNGQGCQNCRNAGSDPSQCQFLRVSSSSVECVEWPYIMGNGSQYAGAANINMYGIGTQGISSSVPTQTPRRVQHPWPYMYPSLQPASDFYNYDMISQETSYDTPYAFHNSSTTFTAASQRPAQQALSSQELLRQWPNLPKVERMQLTSVGAAPSTTSYGSSGISYPVSLAPVTAMDPSICFPSMGALARTLPRSRQTGIRVLPTPRSAVSQAESETQLVTAGSGYGMVPQSTDPSVASWYQDRPVLESPPSASDIDGVHSHGPLSYTNCTKLSSSPPRDQSTAYSCVSIAPNPSISSAQDGIASAFDLRLSSIASTCGEDSLAYGNTSNDSLEAPRGRVPSTGSLSYSTSSTSPKRNSFSSSGTDATLLNVSTHQGVPHLRQIRPAHNQGNSDTPAVRRLQQDRKPVR